jgi:uncharacterized protein (TIGR00106 family)
LPVTISTGATDQVIIHAEISIIPIGSTTIIPNEQRKEEETKPTIATSMSREIAVAFDAISQIKDVKATLTSMGTQIESDNIQNVLKAVEAAHQAVKELGVKRIISTIRIDERLDKVYSLEDRVKSVKEKLPKK